ncbi:PQQ-dependent sugar dehydrogenase [Monashia sp. NPDC004114]
MRMRAAMVALLAGSAVVLQPLATPAEAAAPAFVQARANEVTSGRTNSLAFSNANQAGDLIVVTVVWNNSGAVTVADTRGNAYVSAGVRTGWNNSWSQQTFYAKNVAAGANTVTATFATAISQWGTLYLTEYSGVDKVNPLDVQRSSTGTTAAMSSGAVTTTTTGDLLYAAGASKGAVTAAGPGWTTRSTGFGNRTQDQLAGAAGAYTATGTQDSNRWVMQVVAFRPDTGPSDSTPPTVPTGLSANAFSTTQVNLSWVGSIDNVGVAGYRVYRNGSAVGTSTGTAFQDTGLNPATTYTYRVTAFDAAGNESVQSASADATTQSAPPDTTPPSVSITAPATAATVSASIAVTAAATDTVGVSGVQFLLDGQALGVEDLASPYQITWDTTAATNGSHSLTARARDAAGNTATSAPVAVTVSNTTPQPGAVLAGYAFDEGSGTLAADASGRGLTGTLTGGATWGAGKYGSALLLNGQNQYVALGNPPALRLTGSMTVSAWINSSSFPADDAAVVSRRGSIGMQLDTTIDRGPRTIGFKLTNAAGNDMFRYGATAMLAGTWYHIAGVYNAATSSLDVYLNGVLDNGALVGTVTSTQQNSPDDVLIGRRAGGGFEFLGSLDDVRIYDRALTPSEIRADMNTPLAGGAPTDPNPPTVSISAPAAGAQVSDIVTVTASAADDVGVRGVRFFVDGQSVGAEDTEAPYGFDWDTRNASNGAHTLTAMATDVGGNSTTSAAVPVNVTNANRFQNDVLATGFNLPTTMQFLPDGRLLVAELAGRIEVLSSPYLQPDSTAFLQLTNIGSAGVQQGIYDIALDPDFATNRFYYVFYTLGSPNRDRLSRFTANASVTGTVAGSETVLYQDPTTANAEHHGGAIMFGNDGKLYFTTGEHFDASAAQALNNPRGKIHRINKDGSVPTDDPFYDGAGPNWDSIWAYGLRNPWHGYVDPPTGRMYIGDVGGNDYSTAKEEINIGKAGANYGWPNSEGPCSGQCTSPLYYWAHNGRDSAVVGGFVYHGTQFPAGYQGSYFFADYTQNWIKRLTVDASGNLTGVFNFEPADGSTDGPYGDIVDLEEGPDGALYYLDLGYSDIGATYGLSKLRRIRYQTANLSPIAVAAATPTSGPAPLDVSFSSAGSSDPENTPLIYSWTFGDNTTSTEANPTHRYSTAGQYTARLTVSDGVSATSATPITISAGNVPTPTILTPTDGSTFVAGDVISYSGSATDTEDGTLPASAFTWNIDFLHEGHVHPGTPIVGVKSGTFTIPTAGHDFSGNTRYRITLTVVDSSGLSSSRSVTVFPRKVNLSFASQPSGRTLYLDGIAHTAPFVYDTLIGFHHNIEARNESVNGTSYTFASWSDGGAQQHDIVVPATDATYTATFAATTPPATPAFVQVNSATPQSNQSTVTVQYTAVQTAGNTNVVAIGWNSATGTISSVTDSAGNTYLVAAPIQRGTNLSQSIYYARNVRAAVSNTVMVTFSSAVPYADVRAAEYSGLDQTNPFDAAASGSGSSATASSGTLTTSSAREMVVGAGTTSGEFTGSSTGFTTRVITVPDADILADRAVTSAGPYSADGSLRGSSNWVMQAISLRAAGQ